MVATQFLKETFDSMFSIITSQNCAQNEQLSFQVYILPLPLLSASVFIYFFDLRRNFRYEAIVRVINILVDERQSQFTHFRNVLDLYIRKYLDLENTLDQPTSPRGAEPVPPASTLSPDPKSPKAAR